MFSISFPSFGLLALTYVGLGDAVFGMFRVVGRRLPSRMRMLMRRLYCALQMVASAALHVGMASACYTTEVCEDRPLHRRSCMIMASVSLVTFVVVLGVDRGMEPLLNIPSSHPGHRGGTMARVFNASAVCTGWICMAEGETLGVVLLLAATARRALTPVPLVATVYMGIIKIYTLVHTVWTINHMCRASSRRAPVAVMATILTL